MMNRQAEHVLAFFLAELGTDGIIGNNGEMILTGQQSATTCRRV